MELIGYFASAFIGISLGLIGGGGSILTVPVLVYLFRINPILATSYSLFIVGSTSLITTFNNIKLGLINYKVAFLFGLASIITVLLTRLILVPLIPHNIIIFGNITITDNILMLSLFAILMIIVALNMIYSKDDLEKHHTYSKNTHLIKVLFYGAGVGFTTGLLGAGGGFLIIPTLVLSLHVNIKEAIATSLFIISLNSLIGFVSDLNHFQIDWIFLLKITSIAILGSFIGIKLNKSIQEEKLKKGFGWFILLMGIFILIKENYLN